MTIFKQPLAIYLAKLIKRWIPYTYHRANRYLVRVSEFSREDSVTHPSLNLAPRDARFMYRSLVLITALSSTRARYSHSIDIMWSNPSAKRPRKRK